MKLLTNSILLSMVMAISIQARTTCSQFRDQAQAQKYFDAKKYGYKSLDKDKDGEACECLYGGSSYNKGACLNWRKVNRKQ